MSDLHLDKHTRVLVQGPRLGERVCEACNDGVAPAVRVRLLTNFSALCYECAEVLRWQLNDALTIVAAETPIIPPGPSNIVVRTPFPLPAPKDVESQ